MSLFDYEEYENEDDLTLESKAFTNNEFTDETK